MSVVRCRIILTKKKGTPMGTRNLTVVKNLEGTTKVAQYGQWDGYPSYSGVKALDFLRDEALVENLRNRLTLVEFIDDQEAEAIWEGFDHDSNDPTKYTNEYPGLSRDTGIDILLAVASATETLKTIDNSEFRNDTLFCEGVYEVDFSTNKFISTYADKVVSFDLDTLPTDEEYLKAMGVEQLV
jgi:hypothetical protein